MQTQEALLQEINTLDAQAVNAAQAGREDQALKLWRRILEIHPDHARSLMALGQDAFRKGDLPGAKARLERLVAVDGAHPQQWINLALACQGLKDEQGEEAALQRALTIDPRDLLALILRGNLRERQGKTHQAAVAYGAVAAVAPPQEQLNADLRPAVAHAMDYKEKYDRQFASFIDQYLDAQYRQFAGENLKRFRDSFDIMVGRKKRYDALPAMHYYPGLPAIEFFDRTEFPWLDDIEAATDQIRDEFLNVLQTEQGFEPYISYPGDVPQNQFAELNNSPRWNAFHLYKMGERIEANAAKCPKTMALLDGAPQPAQAGRTPAAMFSLLKPKTRIPPHNGVSNVRLVTHLPLIIPEQCGFRVGNETREWIPGKAWVFDDTIEHEAWNNSEKLRVVFIFDVWHPHLSPPERAMISALASGMNAFSAEAGGFDL